MSNGTDDASWQLTEAAEEDLIEIWREGAKRWGAVQADRYADAFEAAFALLARFPEMAFERRELMPPLRVHPSGAHMILYCTYSDGGILVVRVRHQREDWTTDPL